MLRTQSHTSPRPWRRVSLFIALTTAVLLLAVGAAAAAGTSNIEGVWSFNGGEIAIKSEGNGKYEGIVVKATTFAACPHEVAQQIWKEIAPQADGSYWGLHQWYYEGEFDGKKCVENPVRGDTAFRVVETSNGSYLRVCLSEPGDPQPTIPPGSPGSGGYAGGEKGCVSSALLAPLSTSSNTSTESSGGKSGAKSGTASYIETLSLPNSKKCLSVRLFRIRLKDPEHDAFKKVAVTIKGRKIKTSRHGKYIVATVNLKGLPHGKFTVKISATTVQGNHLTGTRTYHTCAKKAKVSHPKKLSRRA